MPVDMVRDVNVTGDLGVISPNKEVDQMRQFPERSGYGCLEKLGTASMCIMPF